MVKKQKRSATNSNGTERQGPGKLAKTLRSAASALEHGRHATANRKLAEVFVLGLRKDPAYLTDSCPTILPFSIFNFSPTIRISTPRPRMRYAYAWPTSKGRLSRTTIIFSPVCNLQSKYVSEFTCEVVPAALYILFASSLENFGVGAA